MKRYRIWLLGVLCLAGCQKPPAADSATDIPRVVAPALSGDSSHNPDMTDFAKQVDTDGDSHLSRAEWQAQGLPESSFNMFEKGRGYVTLDDYRDNPAPPGIDLNSDGKLTVEEFKEFDAKMSATMNKDGPAPPQP